MTGPEHFAKAEALVKQAADSWAASESGDPYPNAARLLDTAQVHATLALTYATVANRTTEATGANRPWVDVFAPGGTS